MGKKAPQAPPAPDPNVVSAAQTASNVQTAQMQAQLNRVNQQTPYGSLTYTQDPNNPNQYTATQTLSPQEQALYNLSTTGQNLYATTALNQLNAASQSLSTPLQTPVSPFAAYNQAAGPLAQQINLPTSPFAPYQQAAAATQQPFQFQANPYAPLQGAQAATASPFTSPVSPFAAAQSAQGALNQPFNTNYGDVARQYIAAQSQLQQPQWDQMRQNTQSQLANQGIPQGSYAYNNAMRQTENQISNAQAQILSGATQNVATAAQTGINLYQAPLNAAQTAAGVTGQGIQQGLQLYNQPLTTAQALSGLTGGAEQQALAAYQQPLQTAQGLQGLLAGGAQTGIGLQQQAAAAAQAQAGLLGTGLQQAATLQELPLNEASALLSGSQVQQPSFVNAPQTQVQPTNVLAGYDLQQQGYQNQLAGYQAQVGATGGMLGGIGSLAGMLGGAYMMRPTPSDERIKTDIKEVGHLKTPGGKLPIKTFRFKGSPIKHLGFTAQDAEQVDPGAVMTHPLTGLKGVNYARLLMQAGAPGNGSGGSNGGAVPPANNGWGTQTAAPLAAVPGSGWGMAGGRA